MIIPSHQLLKIVVTEKEVTLNELLPVISIKHDDYRDFYPLAFLCTSGFIKHEWSIKRESVEDEKLIASMIYSMATGKKKVNSFNNPQGKPNREIKFISTAKAELYFAERKEKFQERIVTMSIGIVIGVCSTTLAFLIKTNLLLTI